MFNPLHPFEPRFIDLFKSKGVKAFVKQTYKRGRPGFHDPDREGFVLVHFENLLAAQQYFDVLTEDPARELFLTDSPEHVAKINNLLHSASVFTMLKIKDAEVKARQILDRKIRAFIEYNLKWQPSGQDGVRFTLDVQFGEVYAKLRFRSKEIKVKLEEIEAGNYVL